MRALLFPLAALPALASSQWQQPLDVRNHRSVDLVFLRLPPRSHTLEKGGRSLSYSLVGANEFRKLGPIDEDSETWRALVHYSWSLDDREGLFIEAPLIARGGGFMDGLIDWWHNAVIQARNPERDSTPKGRSVIDFPGGGPFRATANIGDLTIGAERQVGQALFRIAAKLPTGNAPSLTGSGAFDFGAALDYRIALGRSWTIDLNGGIVLQGPATRIDGTRRSVYSSAVAVTWAMNGRDAWTAQWNSEQHPTTTGDPTRDQDHRIVSFGYQRRVDERSILQVYFSENGDFRLVRFPGGATVGPDFTVGARLLVRI